MWWQALSGVMGSLLALWSLLLVVLWRTVSKNTLRVALRLWPDLIRLLGNLAADRSLPRAIRIWLTVMAAYLLSPIDLIPDFLPVLGYVDDVIIVVMALRWAIRRAGTDTLQRHWPGNPECLHPVRRLAGFD